MTKFDIYIYSSFISISVLFSGCKKFLDQQPDERTDLNTPEKVAELLTSAYPHGNYITFTESMSDNAGDKGTSGRDIENSLPWMFQDVPSYDVDSPNFYWYECYRAIAAANHALDAIEKSSTPATYKASKGEALVARAYAHFMLVTLFSKAYDPATAATDPGIPYMTQPERVVEGKYERKTVAYVYEQIEKDLLEGLPLISNNSYRVPKFHFTTEAAHAFATRFYLFKRDFQKVIDHANAIYPSTIADKLRPWNTTYDNYTYYVLQAAYTSATESANLLLAEANTVWGRSYAGYNFGLNSAINANVLGRNNPLNVALVMQSNVYGGTPEVYNIPKFVEHFVKENISDNFGDPYNMVPLFTAEEVLFNRAEAHAQLGNTAAVLTDMNAYMSRRIVSYSPTTHAFTEKKATDFFFPTQAVTPEITKSALIQSILLYKRQEYMHEGLRWFDILRHKLPVVHQMLDGSATYTLSADDNRKVLQIPQEARAAGLELNPR